MIIIRLDRLTEQEGVRHGGVPKGGKQYGVKKGLKKGL